MNDLSWMDPPIEVAANSPRVEMITARLKIAGLRPYKAKLPIDFGNPDPLLIDMASVTRETLERVGRACDIGIERTLILLSEDGAVPTLSDAMVVKGDSQLALIPSQLASRRRRFARQREVQLRRETAAELGERLPAPDPDAVPEILYLGDGSPLFLGLQGALKQSGLQVTAALSAHTAMDYVAAKRFAAAIVDLSPDSTHAATFMALAASDGSLAGLPILALVKSAADLSDTQRRALAYATEIINEGIALAPMAKRIDVLSRRHLAATPFTPKRSSTSPLCDLSTGLFSRAFMDLHIERQMKATEITGEPMAVLSLKVSANPVQGMRPAMNILAEHIRNLFRETDCAGAVATDTILVTLPATPYRGGVRLAERIASQVANSTDLNGIDLTWRVVERRKYHSAKTLIGACMTGPYMRTAAA